MSRRLLTILFLLVLAFLSGCQDHQAQPSPTPPVSSKELIVTGLNSLAVDASTANAIRPYLSPFLKTNPYTAYETGSQLLLYLVSSGEFGTVNITLPDGSTFQADVLYVYGLMSNQRVLALPLMIGLTLPDGEYVYFSEKFAFEQGDVGVSTVLDRPTALTDAQSRLPRGRIFRLLAYDMLDARQLLWDKCPAANLFPAEVCNVGAAIEEYHPGVTTQFILRMADRFPSNWLLVGWFFREFSPEEMAPGAPIDVPLPTITPTP